MVVASSTSLYPALAAPRPNLTTTGSTTESTASSLASSPATSRTAPMPNSYGNQGPNKSISVSVVPTSTA